MSHFSSYDLNYKRNANIYDRSTDSQNDTSLLNPKIIEKFIYNKFNTKYNKMPLKYNSIKIDNIIYNDKIHLVSMFKEELLINDNAEFLKRYYTLYESIARLPKYFEFYDLYSKIFPNYTSIKEGKYFYKNIQQKQRVINTIEKIELEAKMNKNKKDDNNESDEKVFSTNVIDSLLNVTNDEGMEMLFNINKQNMEKDDSLFFNDINNIIDEIDKHHNNNNENKENKNLNLIQKKQINHILKINNNKYIIKIKNINCGNINNNINNIKKETHINSIIKNTNKTTKSRSKAYKENKENYNILNLHTKNNYSKLNLFQKPNSKNKNIPKLLLIDKLENNYIKRNQKYSNHKKSFSHNISTSVKSKRRETNSRHNKSLHTRIQSSISDNNNQNIYKNYPSSLKNSKTKKKKNEIINYKKEILKIDLSKSKLSSRNNVFDFSLSKNNNINRYNKTNHNSFLIKSCKSNSKNNIMNSTNILNNATYNHKINNKIKYNFHVIDSYSRNKSYKSIYKIKKSETNRNSKDSKDKNYSRKKIKYIKRNLNKIDCLFNNNTNSMLSYNESKIIPRLKTKHKHFNSILYISNLTTRRESKKNISKNKLFKKEDNENKETKKNFVQNNKEVLQKKYSFKNINNSKIIKKNNSVLKIGIEDNKNNRKGKIKNIKINNFSKLFNVFIKHSRQDINSNSKPQTERNSIKIKV